MGIPEGVKRTLVSINMLRKNFALSPQPCLLAQSRGGLMLYNWAAEHAQ